MDLIDAQLKKLHEEYSGCDGSYPYKTLEAELSRLKLEQEMGVFKGFSDIEKFFLENLWRSLDNLMIHKVYSDKRVFTLVSVDLLVQIRTLLWAQRLLDGGDVKKFDRDMLELQSEKLSQELSKLLIGAGYDDTEEK